MELQKICSGKDKVQVLHLGYRMIWNKGPGGPDDTTYFKCHRRDCKARLATTGLLSGELTLKWHKDTLHIHPPDHSANIVSASLYKFRTQVKQNPEVSAKSVFEQIATDALEYVETPKKLDLATKLPTYRTIKDQGYRQRKIQRPNLPQTINDVDISLYPDLTVTKRGKPFYRGKTKSGGELFMSDA